MVRVVLVAFVYAGARHMKERLGFSAVLHQEGGRLGIVGDRLVVIGAYVQRRVHYMGEVVGQHGDVT